MAAPTPNCSTIASSAVERVRQLERCRCATPPAAAAITARRLARWGLPTSPACPASWHTAQPSGGRVLHERDAGPWLPRVPARAARVLDPH